MVCVQERESDDSPSVSVSPSHSLSLLYSLPDSLTLSHTHLLAAADHICVCSGDLDLIAVNAVAEGAVVAYYLSSAPNSDKSTLFASEASEDMGMLTGASMF